MHAGSTIRQCTAGLGGVTTTGGDVLQAAATALFRASLLVGSALCGRDLVQPTGADAAARRWLSLLATTQMPIGLAGTALG